MHREPEELRRGRGPAFVPVHWGALVARQPSQDGLAFPLVEQVHGREVATVAEGSAAVRHRSDHRQSERIPRVASTVMFIHGSAGGYGADRQLRVLAEGLDRARFAPLVVLPEEGELAAPLREAGIPVHIEPLAVLRRDHLRGRRLVDTIAGYRRNVRVLGALARAHRARIVHSNTSLVLCGQAVADRAGAAHVISVREIYEQTGGTGAALLWPVLRRSLLRADALACVSQACASQFGGSERAFVLHDAVPRDLSPPGRAAARDALGLERDRFIAAVVGRISDWKGQEVFARALAEEPLAEIGACGILAGRGGTRAGAFRASAGVAPERAAVGRPPEIARLPRRRGDRPRRGGRPGGSIHLPGAVSERGPRGRRGPPAGRRHDDRWAGRDHPRRHDRSPGSAARPSSACDRAARARRRSRQRPSPRRGGRHGHRPAFRPRAHGRPAPGVLRTCSAAPGALAADESDSRRAGRGTGAGAGASDGPG